MQSWLSTAMRSCRGPRFEPNPVEKGAPVRRAMKPGRKADWTFPIDREQAKSLFHRLAIYWCQPKVGQVEGRCVGHYSSSKLLRPYCSNRKPCVALSRKPKVLRVFAASPDPLPAP